MFFYCEKSENVQGSRKEMCKVLMLQTMNRKRVGCAWYNWCVFLMLKAKSGRTGRERTKRNIKEIPDDA